MSLRSRQVRRGPCSSRAARAGQQAPESRQLPSLWGRGKEGRRALASARSAAAGGKGAAVGEVLAAAGAAEAGIPQPKGKPRERPSEPTAGPRRYPWTRRAPVPSARGSSQPRTHRPPVRVPPPTGPALGSVPCVRRSPEQVRASGRCRSARQRGGTGQGSSSRRRAARERDVLLVRNSWGAGGWGAAAVAAARFALRGSPRHEAGKRRPFA